MLPSHVGKKVPFALLAPTEMFDELPCTLPEVAVVDATPLSLSDVITDAETIAPTIDVLVFAAPVVTPTVEAARLLPTS
jgi:hypothetical protein